MKEAYGVLFYSAVINTFYLLEHLCGKRRNSICIFPFVCTFSFSGVPLVSDVNTAGEGLVVTAGDSSISVWTVDDECLLSLSASCGCLSRPGCLSAPLRILCHPDLFEQWCVFAVCPLHACSRDEFRWWRF